MSKTIYVRGDITFTFEVAVPDDIFDTPRPHLGNTMLSAASLKSAMLKDITEILDDEMLPIEGPDDDIEYKNVQRTIFL
jgi:hypothetical protein